MTTPFNLAQSPLPGFMAEGLAALANRGQANPFATAPGSPMVSFLSILDQVTQGPGPMAGADLLANTAPPSESAIDWDDASVKDLMAQLLQTLQGMQAQLPPEALPEAEKTLDWLQSLSQPSTSPTTPQDLQAWVETLAPILEANTSQAPTGLGFSQPADETSASPQPDLPQTSAHMALFPHQLKALAHAITKLNHALAIHNAQGINGTTPSHEVKDAPQASNLPPNVVQAAKQVEKLLGEIALNPNAPEQMVQSLPPVPPLQHLNLSRKASGASLVHKLSKALQKAPEAWKPVIEETLSQLAKPHEKTFHPIQMELHWQRPLEVLPEAQATANLMEQPPQPEPTFAETSLVTPSEVATTASTTSSNQPDLAVRLASAPAPDHPTPESTTTVLPPHLQVVQGAKMTLEAGRKQVTLQLNPHHLGQVHLKITSHAHNTVSIRLVAQTPEAYSTLDSTVSQLSQSLMDQGLQIRDIQVAQAASEMVTGNTQTQDFSGFESGTPDDRQNRFDFNQQQNPQQQAQSQHPMFDQSNSTLPNPFTDEGSSMGEEVASSQIAFDTDVEGEEVNLSQSSTQASSGIDIRV